MRKLIVTIASTMIASSSAVPILACAPDNSLKIAFIPSKSNTDVANIVKPLAQKLRAAIQTYDPTFNRNVKIYMTTDYEAAGQSLQDGTSSLAFLPVGTYSKYWGKDLGNSNYSAAAPLVVAQRRGMMADKEENLLQARKINASQEIKLVNQYEKIVTENTINTRKDAYEKLYTPKGEAETQAAFYRTEVLISNKFEDEAIKAGINIKGALQNPGANGHDYQKMVQALLKFAANKKPTRIQILNSNTSSAGVVYPLQWMLKNGIDRVTVSNYFRGAARADNYLQALERLRNGDADITFGYADVRADNNNDSIVKANYEKTKIIGITDGILNDGIAYSKRALSDNNLLWAIRQAFKELIAKPENDSIFDVYTHTNYLIPENGADEAAALKWEQEQNTEIINANKEVESAWDIITKNY